MEEDIGEEIIERLKELNLGIDRMAKRLEEKDRKEIAYSSAD